MTKLSVVTQRKGPTGKARGTVTAKGYRRLWCWTQNRSRFEHVLVWEQANGPIPVGLQVHHRNGDKLDNRLENLELLTPLAHKREHGGCEWRDGVEFKPCRKCRQFYPVDQYYKAPHGIVARCRACLIQAAVANKQRKRSNVGTA